MEGQMQNSLTKAEVLVLIGILSTIFILIGVWAYNVYEERTFTSTVTGRIIGTAWGHAYEYELVLKDGHTVTVDKETFYNKPKGSRFTYSRSVLKENLSIFHYYGIPPLSLLLFVVVFAIGFGVAEYVLEDPREARGY